MKKMIFFLFAAILLAQCASKNPTPTVTPERAFYYWQTTMDFSKNDDSLANNIGLKTIYLRYFDIDWSPGYSMPIPIGVLNKDLWEAEACLKDKNIVPTIFITNRTFKNLDDKGLNLLVENMAQKIDLLNESLKDWHLNSVVEYDDNANWEKYEEARKNETAKFQTMIAEVQIDCDWTASTRDNYFKFLKLLKAKLSDKTLSCTIRLHQYKDRELMGIPPVERGLLMCYNVADVQKLDTKNAILDSEIVEQYLVGKQYPMLLDIGLPMFSWAAWYRGKEFKGIVSNWNSKDAADKSVYSLTTDNRYAVKVDTAIGDNYLREGDLLRWDNGSEKELNKTIDLLIKNLNTSGIRIAFFDWETEKIKQHEEAIKTYYRQFE